MSLLSRVTSLFRPERLNREIDDEQQFHIACRTDELIADGMEPDEAARQARLAFGSKTRARAWLSGESGARCQQSVELRRVQAF